MPMTQERERRSQFVTHKGLQRVLMDYEDMVSDDPRESPFQYVSRPGDGQTRIVFQRRTCHSYAEAIRYVDELIAEHVANR